MSQAGWADVATKKDLEHLATKTELAQAKTELGDRINSLEVRVERGFRRQTVWLAASLGVLFTLNTSLWVGMVVWLGHRLPSS